METKKLQEQVEAAIRRAASVYTEAKWLAWAEGWLSGKDRTAASALIAFADDFADDVAAAHAALAATDAARLAAVYARYAVYAGDE